MRHYNRLLNIAFFLLLNSFNLTSKAFALTFELPPNGDNIVGQVKWTRALPGDNFSLLGRRYDIGYDELVEANPSVNPLNPGTGTIIVIPSRFILPSTPHKGLVVNLVELRLYYYLPNRKAVITYPVGIGRQGWDTPLGPSRIVQKAVNPTWYAPESLRLYYHAEKGIELPRLVLPGPDNPLGRYALRLEQRNYLIHGTNDYRGVGLRSTGGCLRLFPEDIKALFSQIEVGTPVHIINAAYKAGWKQGRLYLEAHVPLSERQENDTTGLAAMKEVVHIANRSRCVTVDWDIASRIAMEKNGIPQVIASSDSREF